VVVGDLVVTILVGEEVVNLIKGVVVGEVVGRGEDFTEGRMEGFTEGRMEGFAEGQMKGFAEGQVEGFTEGNTNEDGTTVGVLVEEMDAREGLLEDDANKTALLTANWPPQDPEVQSCSMLYVWQPVAGAVKEYWGHRPQKLSLKAAAGPVILLERNNLDLTSPVQ